MNTRIFLDSGDPNETKEILENGLKLDGQTTNPTLVSKNPKAKDRFEAGEKFTADEIMDFYKDVVSEVSGLVPESVSIEVYADANTTAAEMIEQARDMYTWIPNAHIKLPITKAGLESAQTLSQEGMRLNLTLCFTQEQGAAVYAATKGAKKGQIFLSPFIGRLDDLKEDGMDLIKNMVKMFESSDGHVEVLTASVRSQEHLYASIQAKTDIITIPYKIMKNWDGSVPEGFSYAPEGLEPIPYKELDINQDWASFDITHPLTDKGIHRFSDDWNALIK
jgi:transaldolase